MLKNGIKLKISGKNPKILENFGKIRKISENFGKNRKKSDIFVKNANFFQRALRARSRGGCYFQGRVNPPLKFFNPPLKPKKFFQGRGARFFVFRGGGQAVKKFLGGGNPTHTPPHLRYESSLEFLPFSKLLYRNISSNMFCLKYFS